MPMCNEIGEDNQERADCDAHMGRLEFCKISAGMDGDCIAMGEEEGLSRGEVTTIDIGGGVIKILLRIRRIGKGEDLED